MDSLLIFSVLLLLGLIVPWAQSLDGRIVGGYPVDITDFPYQVSVRIDDEHLCGGSIIDAFYIITAAHCVNGLSAGLISIRYGNTAHAWGIHDTIDKIIVHPDYNVRTYQNDLAILKLDNAILFSEKSQSIALANFPVLPGTIAWVSGWGFTKQNSKTIPTYLQATDVEVIKNSDCISKYHKKIFFGMICAQTPNHDSCQGDSGGPLVADRKLVGIVSWGIGCANPKFPGVYTDVYYYSRWIDQVTYNL